VITSQSATERTPTNNKTRAINSNLLLNRSCKYQSSPLRTCTRPKSIQLLRPLIRISSRAALIKTFNKILEWHLRLQLLRITRTKSRLRKVMVSSKAKEEKKTSGEGTLSLVEEVDSY
jgi:hypothetical protein